MTPSEAWSISPKLQVQIVKVNIFFSLTLKNVKNNPPKKDHGFLPQTFFSKQKHLLQLQPTNKRSKPLCFYHGHHGFLFTRDVNVTEPGMDYRFVELRCNELCSFPYVQLSHSGLDQPPTYELHAKRRLKMVMDGDG